MLIDINASFGGREQIQRFPLETMLAELGRLPCAAAFVHSRHGVSDARAGNDETLGLCRRHDWLQPVGVIQPRDTFTWRDEIARCLREGVRLFRIYPDQAGWPVDSVLMRQIVERLAGTGAALSVDATQPGLPSQVVALRGDAKLPVIFTEARYFPLSEVLPLAACHPDVFIETSSLSSPEGIERAVAIAGADRLLFGSGTARHPAWVAWQTLTRAAIADCDRERIAWRNAADLFGVTVRDRAAVPAAQEGNSTPGPILDVHLHDRFPGSPSPPYSPADYAAALERYGIRGGVCSSATAILYDLRQGNDELAALLDACPTLRGYVVVDPRYHDDSVRELRRLETDQRFVGVKIHASYSQTPTAAPAMRRLFAAVSHYGKPVLIHNLGVEWPEALVELACEFPTLPIIAAHAGYGDGPHPTHNAANRLAAAPNIALEFCSTYLVPGAIRRGLEAVGPDRLLFGSDFPLIAIPYMRAAYDELALTGDDAAAVWWRNACRLFPELAPIAHGHRHTRGDEE